ncbi:MAG TPA: alpha/beta fold hydrolase [Pyrinomonadaceae bacterium]|nr:alpha/beta fold hydrolase [Pyrinomonadaceae bacterium]
MHGALGDYRTWNQQAATLAQQYHVISYTRRYHQPNSSTNGADDYTYRRHVDDLISLIHAFGLGPAHLVGHSYGAACRIRSCIWLAGTSHGLHLEESRWFFCGGRRFPAPK